ncbi:MAG: SGNH/GDSL hydrolase family protein [Candidatus Methylomirabilia bacterium]
MKRFSANGLLVLGSLVLALVTLESALAVFAPHKILTRAYHERYDPVLGWVNKPLKDEGVHFEYAPNRFFHVAHNSRGLRGKETGYEKRPGTRRLLFVGDSYFWGYGVSDSEVLTEELQRVLPHSYEVLNGGTSGYGTDQAYLWLKNEGLKYRPDIVVFSFSAANDLDEIATSVAYFTPKPVFVLEGGVLVLKNVPVPRTEQADRKSLGSPRTAFGKLKQFLRYHTHTYPFIAARLNSRPEWRDYFVTIGLADEYMQDIGDVPVITNPPQDVLDVALKLILDARKISEEAGARFVLVFIPDKEQAPDGKIRVEAVKENAYVDNSERSSVFREFAGRYAIPYLDLLPVVREHARKGEALYNSDRTDHHWNALGHRVFSAEIQLFMTANGMLHPPPPSEYFPLKR